MAQNMTLGAGTGQIHDLELSFLFVFKMVDLDS